MLQEQRMLHRSDDKRGTARQVKERECLYGKSHTRKPTDRGGIYHYHHSKSPKKNGARYKTHHKNKLYALKIVKSVQDSKW